MKRQKKDVWKRGEEKRNIKMCIYESKKKVNKQFGRKMNEDGNGNRKSFWKEVSNAKEGKDESCSRVKDGNGRLAQGEDESRMIWKEYFEDLHNIDTQEEVAVHMCGYVWFEEETILEESQLEKLKLRKELRS